jgi:hypothetical protein
MAKNNCRLFHDWSKWKTITVTGTSTGRSFDTNQRKCNRCNFKQRKSV